MRHIALLLWLLGAQPAAAQEDWRLVAPPGWGFSVMVPNTLQPFGLSSTAAPGLMLRSADNTVRVSLFWQEMAPGGLAQALGWAMAEDQGAGFAPIPKVQTETAASWTSTGAGWLRAGRLVAVCTRARVAGFVLEYGTRDAVAGAALAESLAAGLRETGGC